jgi:hypothetical protein
MLSRIMKHILYSVHFFCKSYSFQDKQTNWASCIHFPISTFYSHHGFGLCVLQLFMLLSGQMSNAMPFKLHLYLKHLLHFSIFL